MTADEADRGSFSGVEFVPTASAPANLLARVAPRIRVRAFRARVIPMKVEAGILDEVAANECFRATPMRRAFGLLRLA